MKIKVEKILIPSSSTRPISPAERQLLRDGLISLLPTLFKNGLAVHSAARVSVHNYDRSSAAEIRQETKRMEQKAGLSCGRVIRGNSRLLGTPESDVLHDVEHRAVGLAKSQNRQCLGLTATGSDLPNNEGVIILFQDQGTAQEGLRTINRAVGEINQLLKRNGQFG